MRTYLEQALLFANMLLSQEYVTSLCRLALGVTSKLNGHLSLTFASYHQIVVRRENLFWSGVS
jgi:hypothetical protein